MRYKEEDSRIRDQHMQNCVCVTGMGNSGKGNKKFLVPQWGLGRQLDLLQKCVHTFGF